MSGEQSEGATASESSAATTYSQTKYPIVLAHGMLGFQKMVGVVDYFFSVPGALTDAGAEVYVTEVSALNTVEIRGESVLKQVEDIVARSGKPKVNLIGHSQGGLEARYVAAARPDLVASITTIGTPHLGAELADWFITNGYNNKALAIFGDNAVQVWEFLAGANGLPQDTNGLVKTLSSASATAFNQKYPAGVPTTRCGQGAASANGMNFYSIAGTSVGTNVFDVLDPILTAASKVYKEQSDGLVGQCSAHFGTVLRDNYTLNHLDEINQVLSLTASNAPDIKGIYRDQANRLKNDGT